ncbi:uncharacterized protein LOC115627873 [Scaptodrosophila lebanonensis]|uniref:Uncharacterized protein LOC115627873 n=1 Tax=Drosophila lebanonensis TaxID=7225 RepID=A0A6J2TXI9_DROLE|nr:uncharacterized protein LOC115627873 [Scaptodrosophila lebanonensis]
MRQIYALPLLLLLALSQSRADLFGCDEKLPEALAEIGSDIGGKLSEVTGVDASSASAESEVRDFFKNVGCHIKKGVSKAGEHAKKLGAELKEGAKKLGEKAKDLGSDIKERFEGFRDKLSKESVEEMSQDRSFLANVEIMQPEVLKGETQCGHGHILDALGNCSKLRK